MIVNMTTDIDMFYK